MDYLFISIKFHCQPCASYSNRRRGVWSLAVTTVLLTLWGGFGTQETDMGPAAQGQLLQWNLTFRLMVVFCQSQIMFSPLPYTPQFPPNLSHLDSLSKGF